MKQSNRTFYIPRFSLPGQKYTCNSTGKKRERLHQVHKNFVLSISDKFYTDVSGKMSGKTSGKILDLIESNKYITIPEIAAIIGVTERSIERNIQNLQKEIKLKRVGSAKGGHWEIIKKEDK